MKLMPAAWCYYLLLNVMRGGLGWRLVARFPRRVADARGCCLLEPSLVLQVQQVGNRMLLFLICRVRGPGVFTALGMDPLPSLRRSPAAHQASVSSSVKG